MALNANMTQIYRAPVYICNYVPDFPNWVTYSYLKPSMFKSLLDLSLISIYFLIF
jgi:hypothetical protein